MACALQNKQANTCKEERQKHSLNAASNNDGCSLATLDIANGSSELRTDLAAGARAGAEPSAEARGTCPGPSGRTVSSTDTTGLRRYLVYFLHRHLDFRWPELQAIAAMVSGSGGMVTEPPTGNAWSPFWYVWLPSDEAARVIASRTLLVKVRYARARRSQNPVSTLFSWGGSGRSLPVARKIACVWGLLSWKSCYPVEERIVSLCWGLGSIRYVGTASPGADWNILRAIGLPLQVILDVWAEGADWLALEGALRQARGARQAWLQDGRSMRVLVNCFLRRMPLADQIAAIERLGFLGFKACPCRSKRTPSAACFFREPALSGSCMMSACFGLYVDNTQSRRE